MPELYLLIIFSAVLSPSIGLLLVLLSLFGWMGLSDVHVRAGFTQPPARLRQSRTRAGRVQQHHHLACLPTASHPWSFYRFA